MEEPIRLMFITGGGAGSIFPQANFIYCVRRFLDGEPVFITVFGHKSEELNQIVFGDGTITACVYSASEIGRAADGDLVIQLNFYPEILKQNQERIQVSAKLAALVQNWQDFFGKDPTRNFCLKHPYYDVQSYIYAINNGRNCLNCFDINGHIGMSGEYVWHPRIEDEPDYLKKLGLQERKYITLQWGATPGMAQKTSPKIWLRKYYEELVPLLKKFFPSHKIVQLGEEGNSEPIQGVEVNLLSQTSWNELGILLQNAWLHIDGECGMVHFRKALMGGPSVVLFGPTPVEFYGYEDNLNITANACKHWCARLKESWAMRCVRGDGTPRCMASITPGRVLERIMEQERIETIRNGGVWRRAVNGELYTDAAVSLDRTYQKDFLDNMTILHYEIVPIKLKALYAHFPVDGRFTSGPLAESPAYAMAKGEEDSYDRYADTLRREFGDDRHCLERCKALFASLDRNGFDERSYILVDRNNMILDGQHRAAWQMSQFGEDYEVRVLRIYALKDDENKAFFPFEMVPRGSRLILYGAGVNGLSYLRELRQTDYAQVVALADRKPDGWNCNGAKRKMIRCMAPEELRQMPQEAYDYVVIAIQNEKISRDILQCLTDMEIPEDRIISKALHKTAMAASGRGHCTGNEGTAI